MYHCKYVVQEAAERVGKIADAVTEMAQIINFAQFNAAVAYATHSGVQLLDTRLTRVTEKWVDSRKRWLLSIDDGRTSPTALAFLQELPNSEVRVFKGRQVLDNLLQPVQGFFHPKCLAFEGPEQSELGLISGSANLSWSALQTNAEVAVAQYWKPVEEATDEILEVYRSAAAYLEWFEGAWDASPAVSTLLEDYHAIWDEHAIDLGSERPPRNGGGIEGDFLEAAVTADYFWVETQQLGRNLGGGKPGNQIDLTRGTRVFFGFPMEIEPPEGSSVFGGIVLVYDGNEVPRNMRETSNQMDKLNLPVPGTDGPATYDDRVLLFKNLGSRRFKLDVIEPAEFHATIEELGRLSTYEMVGGRRYGLIWED